VVSVAVASDPCGSLSPDQSPLALQLLGLLVTLHDRYEVSPVYTEVGVAASVTAGRVVTLPLPPWAVAPTLTVANPVPVAVLQVRVNMYVWTLVRAGVSSSPEVDLLPDQSSLATHDFGLLVTLHLRCVLPPALTEAG
jgi:hypothetical protein